MMIRAAVMGAVVLGLGAAASVRAEPRDALIWRAPGGCPDAGDVRARIERRLGSGASDAAVRGVAVDVVDRGEGGTPRFVARIELRGLRGADAVVSEDVRVLSSARCDELADAVAVVIARLAAEQRPPPAGPLELRLARQGEAQALPVPADLGIDLRVLGVSGIGAQPGVSVGGELAGTVRLRSAIVELAGVRWLSSARVPHAGAPDQVDVDLRLAALRLGWGSAQLPLRAWISGELGTLRGGNDGSIGPRMATARWLAAGGGFAVAWPMGPRARLIGTIEVAVPVQQARIVLEDGSELYRSAWAAVRSGLGLEIGWL
jgi:hypothetical protein